MDQKLPAWSPEAEFEWSVIGWRQSSSDVGWRNSRRDILVSAVWQISGLSGLNPEGFRVSAQGFRL